MYGKPDIVLEYSVVQHFILIMCNSHVQLIASLRNVCGSTLMWPFVPEIEIEWPFVPEIEIEWPFVPEIEIEWLFVPKIEIEGASTQ